MPLVFQTLQVPFTGGVDQKTADEYLDSGTKILSVTNGVYLHDGSIEKRFGVTILPNAPSYQATQVLGNPERIFTRGTELCLIDGDSAWAFGPSVGQWGYRAFVSPCVATRDTLYSIQNSPYSSFTLDEGSGLRIVAFRTGGLGQGDIFVTIYDLETGAALVTSAQMTTGGIYYCPVVKILGPYAYLWYADSNGLIYCNVLTISGLSWFGAVAPVVDSDFTMFDLQVEYGASTPGLILFYAQKVGSASSPRYLRFELLPSTTFVGSGVLETYTGTTVTTLLSCRYDSALGTVVFAWEKNVSSVYTMHSVFYDPSTWTPTEPVFPLTLPGYPGASGTSGLTLSVEPISNDLALYVGYYSSSIYTSVGSLDSQQDYRINPNGITQGPSESFVVSRPFRVLCGNDPTLFLLIAIGQEFAFGGTPNSVSYLLVDAQGSSSPRVVATVAPRQGNYSWAQFQVLVGDLRNCTVTNLSNPVAGTYRTLAAMNPSEEFNALQLDLITFDFTGATNWQTVEGVGETFISGGVPSFYDGGGVGELGFFQWPSGITYSINTSTGNLDPGTYGYAFCFAALDNAGLIHRSTFWNATIPIAGPGSNNEVTFTIPSICYTNRELGSGGRTPVVEVYRTTADNTTYYFAGLVNCPLNPGGTVSITDSLDNTTLATNPLMYTTGGVIDSVNPPSFRCYLTHNERIWGIDDTGFIIWYSTSFSASDAPYYNEGLTIEFSEQPLTALAVMDSNLIVFAANRIWVVQGDGPDPTGQGSSIQPPNPIQTDVGTLDWRSVVSMPNGIMFQADSGGIYMLGRDFSVNYVGKTVQDWMAGARVLSSTLTSATNHVRFVLDNGNVLIYDYVLDRWSQFNYEEFGVSFLTSTVLGTTWIGADASQVYEENNIWADVIPAQPSHEPPIAQVLVWVPLTVTTGWVKLASLQGYQRLSHAMGYARFLEGADLNMTLAFDYGLSSQSASFPYSALVAANPIAAQCDMHAQAISTKSMSCQVVLTDAAPTGLSWSTGQGARFLGVAFTVQSIGNRYMKIPKTVKA